jgi:hypothetical protein
MGFNGGSVYREFYELRQTQFHEGGSVLRTHEILWVKSHIGQKYLRWHSQRISLIGRSSHLRSPSAQTLQKLSDHSAESLVYRADRLPGRRAFLRKRKPLTRRSSEIWMPVMPGDHPKVRCNVACALLRVLSGYQAEHTERHFTRISGTYTAGKH